MDLDIWIDTNMVKMIGIFGRKRIHVVIPTLVKILDPTNPKRVEKKIFKTGVQDKEVKTKGYSIYFTSCNERCQDLANGDGFIIYGDITDVYPDDDAILDPEFKEIYIKFFGANNWLKVMP